LTSAGIFVFIFMISGFHTGDLNPIWTVPMLGTHQARLAGLRALSFLP